MTNVNKMMSDNSYINMREMLKDCISDVQVRPANIGCRNLESKLPVLLSSTNHGYSRYYGGGYIVARQTDIGEDRTFKVSRMVIYGVTDSDDVAVHIKKHFLLISQIPDLEEYLKFMLDIFFRTARTLDVEVEKCRLYECE